MAQEHVPVALVNAHAFVNQDHVSAAVVHLHSTYSVAVSALADVDTANVLPPITAYYVMRVGRLPLVAYHPPGDLNLAATVRRLAGKSCSPTTDRWSPAPPWMPPPTPSRSWRKPRSSFSYFAAQRSAYSPRSKSPP